MSNLLNIRVTDISISLPPRHSLFKLSHEWFNCGTKTYSEIVPR